MAKYDHCLYLLLVRRLRRINPDHELPQVVLVFLFGSGKEVYEDKARSMFVFGSVKKADGGRSHTCIRI